jgi:hypothetical protein
MQLIFRGHATVGQDFGSLARNDTMAVRKLFLYTENAPLKPLGLSPSTFQSGGIDVHQFVGLEERFDLGPAAGEQRVIFISTEIAEPQMYHSWRR